MKHEINLDDIEHLRAHGDVVGTCADCDSETTGTINFWRDFIRVPSEKIIDLICEKCAKINPHTVYFIRSSDI